MTNTLLPIALLAATLASAGQFEQPCRILDIADSAAHISIRWAATPKSCAVVYGATTDYGDTVPCEPRRDMKVHIGGLVPNSRYYYNVIADSAPLLDPEIHYFLTAPSDRHERTVIAALGDTRQNHESFATDHRAVVESIISQTRPDLLIHTGDLVDAADPASWTEFFGVQANLLARCPIFPVRGNSDGDTAEFAEQFSLPGAKTWYTRTHGPLYMIFLDAQYRKPASYDRAKLGPDSEQYRWLAARLSSEERRKSAFTMVVMYAPLLLPDNKGAAQLSATLIPLFEEHGVDLVLSGGAHYFSYANRNGIAYVVTGGGGAALERPGRHRLHDVKFWHSSFHHVRLTAAVPTLTIEAIDNTGSAFFTHRITEGAVNTRPAQSSGNLQVQVFGSPQCAACIELKNRILPSILAHPGLQSIDTSFVDIENPDNFEKYVQLEAAAGSRKHTFPVVAVGSRLLSGSQISEESLRSAILEESRGRTRRGSGAPQTAKQLLLGAIVAGSMLGTVIAIRRKQGRRT